MKETPSSQDTDKLFTIRQLVLHHLGAGTDERVPLAARGTNGEMRCPSCHGSLTYGVQPGGLLWVECKTKGCVRFYQQ